MSPIKETTQIHKVLWVFHLPALGHRKKSPVWRNLNIFQQNTHKKYTIQHFPSSDLDKMAERGVKVEGKLVQCYSLVTLSS